MFEVSSYYSLTVEIICKIFPVNRILPTASAAVFLTLIHFRHLKT